jgi:hypothetical protein
VRVSYSQRGSRHLSDTRGWPARGLLGEGTVAVVDDRSSSKAPAISPVGTALSDPGGEMPERLWPDAAQDLASGATHDRVRTDSLPDSGRGLTAPRCTLVVRDGPFAGRRFEVESTLEIGRQSTSCRLDDDRVSHRHAVVRVDGHDVVIEDLGSTNGTWVNGVRVDGPVALRDEDVVRVGATTLAVELSAPSTVLSASPAQHVSQGHAPTPAINRRKAPGIAPDPSHEPVPAPPGPASPASGLSRSFAGDSATGGGQAAAIALIEPQELPSRARRSIIIVALTAALIVAAIVTALILLADGNPRKSTAGPHTTSSALSFYPAAGPGTEPHRPTAGQPT